MRSPRSHLPSYHLYLSCMHHQQLPDLAPSQEAGPCRISRQVFLQNRQQSTSLMWPFPSLPSTDTIGDNTFCTVLTAAQQEDFLPLQATLQEIEEFERMTRDQSSNPKWQKLRRHRLTASRIGEVSKAIDTFHRALAKDKGDPKVFEKPEKLAQRLKSAHHRTTKAMREGLENEPVAAEGYIKENNELVNIYPCGIVIQPRAFWLTTSPDRKVFDPAEVNSFGLLEINCPDMGQNDTLEQLDYMTRGDTGLRLKTSSNHHYQVQMQMAVTGLPWTDFYVWSRKVTHLERINFDAQFWTQVKNNVDEFYFSFF